jgi:hypothetical protein
VCHPFPVNARWTVVENATDGNRGSGHVYVLPALLDKAFLSENLRDVIAKKTPLERMFRHEQFTPGYLDMRLSNGRWDINPVSIDTLKGRALRVRLAQKKKVPLKNSRYIYILIDTDPHWGNPWKVYFWNETSGNWLGTTPALIELLRRDGMLSDSAMPIHGFFLLDDGVHGNHFGTQKQPHQDHLPFWMIESWFQNILERAEQSRKPKVAMDALRESRLFALEQIKARGEHRLQNQLREYKHRMLAPNLDFFVALLRQVHTAGIKFRGISHYLGKSFDSRDLGAISFGDGNHNQKTIDYELSEGFQYCEWLIARLLSMEECGAFSSQLEQLIKSPIYGSIHIGLGTVQGGEKGCEWALSLRSNPTAKSGMGDPLRNAAKKLIARGNFARFFQGKPIIDLSGDVHRFGRVEIPGAPGKGRTVINCASGTDTDSFGEIIGFSPNNCGNIIVGIPVDGPENGEVRVIPFTFDWLEEQFDNPQPINWNLILRDPA